MKLSKETISVIKNFASINNNLLIKSGSVLSTINAQKNVLADAKITETFPIDFGVYDANEFLGVLSLFNDPDIDFNSKFAKISDGVSSVKYFAADETVLTYPKKQINFPSADVEFELSENQLSSIMKTSSVLRAPDVSIVGDGSNLSVIVGDLKNPVANSFDVLIGTTDKTFTANFRVENLKLMPGKYDVAISSKKISRFTSEDKSMNVFVALESTSVF